MSINVPAHTPEPIVFADKIIEAFRLKSFDHCKSLFIDPSGYNEMLDDFFQNNHISEKDRNQFLEQRKLFVDSAELSFRHGFERLIQKGEKLGIDWSQITISRFVFEESKPKNSNKTYLSGHLNFLHHDTTFVIFGIEAIKLSDGYKISDIRTILKGGVGQYIDPDLLDDDDK